MWFLCGVHGSGVGYGRWKNKILELPDETVASYKLIYVPSLLFGQFGVNFP